MAEWQIAVAAGGYVLALVAMVWTRHDRQSTALDKLKAEIAELSTKMATQCQERFEYCTARHDLLLGRVVVRKADLQALEASLIKTIEMMETRLTRYIDTRIADRG